MKTKEFEALNEKNRAEEVRFIMSNFEFVEGAAFGCTDEGCKNYSIYCNTEEDDYYFIEYIVEYNTNKFLHQKYKRTTEELARLMLKFRKEDFLNEK